MLARAFNPLRRSVPRSASTASTSWSSARRITPRRKASAAASSPSRSPSTPGPQLHLRVLKTPPASRLLLKAAGIPKGSAEPHKTKVAKISWDQVREIAETKKDDLNANDVDQAAKIIAAPRGRWASRSSSEAHRPEAGRRNSVCSRPAIDGRAGIGPDDHISNETDWKYQ